MKTNSLFPKRQKRSLIQWPTERQVEEVSARLARMVKVGVRWEAKGDYFSSGDLAYQIQESSGRPKSCSRRASGSRARRRDVEARRLDCRRGLGVDLAQAGAIYCKAKAPNAAGR
jgi:hypothetical protein